MDVGGLSGCVEFSEFVIYYFERSLFFRSVCEVIIDDEWKTFKKEENIN